MARATGLTGRLLYGAFFLAGVPLLAVLWALGTSDVVSLPALHRPVLGAAMCAGGLALMGAGWAGLIVRGRGLPMNAFPPLVLVSTGIYGWVSDPIYLGFGALAAGVSIATGSASGLWLVTPALWLAMAALVAGYERSDLRRRFGDAFAPRPRFAWPRGGDERPGGWERASVFLLVFGPCLLAYCGVRFLGPPADAFPIEFAFERNLPVLQWTEAVYALAYVFIPVTPLLIRTRSELRRFAFAGLVSTVVGTLLWIAVPVVVQYRPFEPTGLAGRLLRWERDGSSGVAAFPAFHVVWAFIAASAWSRIGGGHTRTAMAAAGWTLALLIAASCITTGMHASLDIVAAILVFVPLRDPALLWENLRDAAETVANSWREWRLGPVRFLSHGFFAALAAALGFALAATAAGPGPYPYIWLIAGCTLLGAGLWAQALEGSSKLLRPFGYYGAIIGGLVGVAMAGALGANVLLLLGAWAVAAPWIQVIGRLRCLVQGCCHGGPAPPAIGIRYFHRRSRVTQIANLAGTPLHATPVYSILANSVTGVLLLRLWTAGAAPALVFGVYMMLNAAARFVEESYRAEPQTPVVGRLHVYHWFALAAFSIGAVATTLGGMPPAEPFGGGGTGTLIGALVFGALAGFAMGVDFPRSDRRFSRLAAVDRRKPPVLGPPAPPANGGHVKEERLETATSGSPRSPT